MIATEELAAATGTAAACEALGLPRASLYRHRQPRPARPRAPRPKQERALAVTERATVLDVLNSERFADQAPAEIHATLLDEGTYHCSVRTMHRILAENNQVRERRNLLRHPAYAKPELLATGPKQVWSWDITKLRGPGKWNYFQLYVIIDIFSRYVVGWIVATVESATLAEKFIADTYTKEKIVPGTLTLHADRGPSMKSKPVEFLLADLGVAKTHSRPHVSDDNPFSEAQFKTLKYRHDFPDRFGSIEHAREHCQEFFPWYNKEHHHSGIAMLTPHDVHHGHAEQILEQRRVVLAAAYAAHPERFPRGVPTPLQLPHAVWINPPKPIGSTDTAEPNAPPTTPLEVPQDAKHHQPKPVVPADAALQTSNPGVAQ